MSVHDLGSPDRVHPFTFEEATMHGFPSSAVEGDRSERPDLPDTDELVVERYATAELPTRYGTFQIVSFVDNGEDRDHVAVVNGDVAGREGVLTRVHSECVTGDVFGSLRCDCGEQLDKALETLGEVDRGILLYMRQEGRGIGLTEKVKAYELQDEGLDTVEANRHLGFDDDLRDYSVAAGMLDVLGPQKVRGLLSEGIEVERRIPLKVLPNPHNVEYLETKRRKSGHLL
ncbi:MAG: GTP cyclohydrolase II [Bradymonadaceae bacterium]